MSKSFTTGLRKSLALAATAAVAVTLAVAIPSPAVAEEVIPTPAPVADILDVDFGTGSTVDRAQGLAQTVHGTPTLPQDEALARTVAAFDGSAGYSYDLSQQWDALTDGFTLECAFRYDGPMPQSGDTLPCAARWGGGFTIYLSGGHVGFQIHNGGYRAANVPFEAGHWYHATGVFDGETVKLYLDGEEIAETTAPGPMVKPNHPNAERLVLGAGGNSGGGIGSTLKGAVAAARIYSEPLAPDAVTAVWENFQTPPPATAPVADVLDVDFAYGIASERAQGLPQTQHGEATFAADETLARTVANFDGTDDAFSYQLDESQWSKLTDGFTLECAFRYDGPIPQSGDTLPCSARWGGGFTIYLSGGHVGFQIHNGGYVAARLPFEAGHWYHATGVFDGETVKLYIDGELVSETAAPGPMLLPNDPAAYKFTIGAGGTTSGVSSLLKGAAAAARVYSEPASAAQVSAIFEKFQTPPDLSLPEADIVDIDFEGGRFNERVSNAEVRVFGDPEFSENTAVNATVARFDGAEDAVSWQTGEHWDLIKDGFTLECTFKYDGDLPASATPCSNRWGGGFTIYVSDVRIGFQIHNGGYRAASVPMVADRWYNVVGVYDGSNVSLYLDGQHVATSSAPGKVHLPNDTDAYQFVLGGGPHSSGGVTGFTPVTVKNARIYSEPLGRDDIAKLAVAAVDTQDAKVSLAGTVPAADSKLTSPVLLETDIVNSANASDWVFLLDGTPVNPGEPIGAGLAAGAHELTITATDHFANPISWRIPFTSDAIPSGAGVNSSQQAGSVTLSAAATEPTGRDVTTTFHVADASAARGGFQGVVDTFPTSLEFDHSEALTFEGDVVTDGDLQASASTAAIPFQRFDLDVTGVGAGALVNWSGIVDPARAVAVHAWDPNAAAWTELGSSRGSADGNTVVSAPLGDEFVVDGIAHMLVTGQDPFADDLAPRDERAQLDKDSFEDPAEYDFAITHYTDTQFISEGATGVHYNYDGTQDQRTAVEAETWADAYRGVMEWIVENSEERKIAFNAHSGDVIENLYIDPEITDDDGNPTLPGVQEQADEEFVFAESMHDILEAADVVNQVVAGNHDNIAGAQTGPDSQFNDHFGPERYYAAAQDWREDASYHAWDEELDDEGNLVEAGRDNQNNYVLFSAGGLDFVSVGLSYGITQEEAEWASSIFERFSDRNGILVTHSYLRPTSTPDGRGAAHDYPDGHIAYNEVVIPNENVFLVLAGHQHGVGTNVRTDIGANVDTEHNVVELLADYQDYRLTAGELWPEHVAEDGSMDLDGDGTIDRHADDSLQFGAAFMRMLQFDVERSEMSVDTYSPFLDNFGATEYDTRNVYTGAEDNMVLPVDLTSRVTSFATDGLTLLTPTDQVIGEVTTKSGWPASVEWQGLTEGQTYAWTATSRPAGTETAGTIQQFGNVFIASPAGTDTTAPELTVPEATMIELGQTFDPMTGVTATDDTDGDLTASVSVSGSVDMTTAGAYSLVYTVADSNGNQAVVSRVVLVVEPETEPEPSEPTPTEPKVPAGDLYSTAGFHNVNGRRWYTACEPYSQTIRCTTDIWGTQVKVVDGKFVGETGWHFNNLTYLPQMTRAQWAGNPLGYAGEWTSDEGRRWRTECDTTATGKNGCRSFIWTDLVESSQGSDGVWTHAKSQAWVFNNMVRFK